MARRSINKTIMYPTFFSFATGAADKPQILRIRKASTFTGPTWTDIETGVSAVEELTAGTWNSDGDIVQMQVIAGKGDPSIINIEISPTSLFVVPGDNLVVTCEGIGSAGENTGSISWLEDQ